MVEAGSPVTCNRVVHERNDSMEFSYETSPAFIILHDADTGCELMLNPKAIEMIEGSRISFQQYAVIVKEDYTEIKRMLINAYSIK